MVEVGSISEAVRASAEIRLLRQDNLAFTAEVIWIAFRDRGILEVPEDTLLRIIKTVRDRFNETGEYKLKADPAKYLADWIRSPLSEPWFATRLDEHNDKLIVLRPQGRKAIAFIEQLGSSGGVLAESALSSLGDFVQKGASRISGDTDQMVDLLQQQKAEIDDRIAEIRAKGVEVITDLDRQEMAQRLVSETTSISAGFAQIPSEIRRLAQDNEEFIQSTEGPLSDRFEQILDRRDQFRASADHRVLESLHELHASREKKQKLEKSLNAVVEECEEFLTVPQIRQARGLFTSLTEVASKILVEYASMSRQFEEFVKDPDFATRRTSAQALKGARDAMLFVRDHGNLGKRDQRLSEIGLEITQAPMLCHPQFDLKFTMPSPQIEMHADTLPALDMAAADNALERSKDSLRKGWILSRQMVRARIEKARDKYGTPSLADILRDNPVRYGVQEIAAYLSVAGNDTPTVYTPGNILETTVREGHRYINITCPNPIFVSEGSPSQGLEEYFSVTDFGTGETLKEKGIIDDVRELTVTKFNTHAAA